ncbi:kinase-like domain-containing protein [Mycena polygramma]|nr:kinase-like domain-containing protein [Mycena polygramma]
MTKTSETLPNLTGTLVDDGRLELLKIIGAGAFGITYKARVTTTPSPTFYAVKCLKKPANSQEADFQAREHALHRRVSRHPNVVGVRRHFTDEQHVFIVMELCEGGDMHGAIVDGVYRRNPELIKRTFADLIDGVRFCHSVGVYHRDLKPANVLVNASGGRPLIADFGLSTASRMSRELGCGSPGYMSPESFKPASKSAPSNPYCPAHSDAWALAVILINLVTAQNPWEAAKAEDRRWNGFLADPDFLREILPVSRPLQELLKRCFDLNPALRPTLTQLRAEVLALPELFMSAADLEKASPGLDLQLQRQRVLD